MSLVAYRLLHIFSMMLLFTSLGGLLLASRAGITTGVSRKTAGMTHGIALILLLITGFGALAKTGLSNPGLWPAWLWIKALIRRSPNASTLLWWILPLLGALAAYMALYKPVL